MNASDIEAIVAKVLSRIPVAGESSFGCDTQRNPVPIEVSARHVHLTAEVVTRLFGSGAALTPKRQLSQPGEFLAEQRVKLVSRKGEIANAAVLGPVRKNVQIELSATDCRQLGLNAPLRLSGDLRGAADVLIVGDSGMLEAAGSVIIAQSHLHLRPQDAAAYGVADGQSVRIAVESARPLTFEGVTVRVSPNFAPAFHIDPDEANACLFTKESRAYLLGTASGYAIELLPQELKRQYECGERLITEAIAYRMAAECTENVLHLQKGVVITPSAKDVFKTAKLRITYD